MSDKCPECGADLKNFYRDKIAKELKEEFKKEKTKDFLELNNELDKLKLENTKLSSKNNQSEEILKAQIRQDIINEYQSKDLEFKKEKILLQGKISSLENDKEAAIQIAVSKALQTQETHWVTKQKLDMTEKENEILRLNKLIEEIQDKKQQKSQQAKGEIGEILIENTLKLEYPIDKIEEVPKGQNGADICHYVRDKNENDIGLIYIESKYAKKFSSAWVNKLKEDKKNKNADYAILVTFDIPENSKNYEEDDLFICGFHEYHLAVKILRNKIVELEKRKVIELNKNNATRVYEFMTSKEFAQWARDQINFFSKQKEQLDKEKKQAKKSFEIREEQLRNVMESQSTLAGKLIGISSNDDFKMLDDLTDEIN